MRDDDARNRFLQELNEDVASGKVGDLASYQARFPGHEGVIAEEYERVFGEASLPTYTPEPETVPDSVLEALRESSAPATRYELGEEVARGGMGVIREVFDRSLKRRLAMKIVRRDLEGVGASAPTRDLYKLARFLEEAHVTGQLDHPGVVPVHELGINGDGEVYFTMRMVEGRHLGEVLTLARRGAEGWSVTRVLNVLLRACETMSFAHSKGVIHRDLKPENVMVGRFGEVYVLDWGLARSEEREDGHDLRVALDPASRGSTETSAETPLFTMDGTVVGTPAYMPPEQASGPTPELGPRSDVYSMGAILYELLAGCRPYGEVRRSAHAILAALVQGPPKPAHALNPEVPAELLAVCERAMARDPAERYADMQELADDLRAYLEHRVVSAYETGALAELRKWVRRNRGLSAALAGAFFLALVGLAVSLFLRSRADENAALAQSEKRNVLRLSAFQDLEALVREADSEAMWPVHPDRIRAYEDWLARARGPLAGLHADPTTGAPGHYELLEDLERRVAEHGDVETGETGQERWWLEQVRELVSRLEAFDDPATGLVAGGVSPEWGWSVRRRLDFAGAMRSRTLEEPGEAWDSSIAWAASHGPYRGLVLEPQLGLVPLGPDPASGWLEFADLQTGEAPRRGANGALSHAEGDGLVFVLLPGGTFFMGSQDTDPDAPNYFRPEGAPIEPDELPVHEVTLDPFLVSKYEMTQAQWKRFTGRNPSSYPAGAKIGKPVEATNPVEGVTWHEATDVLRKLGFELPTEAQWEYAARAGTTTIWSFGNRVEDSGSYSNVSDAFGSQVGPKGWCYEAWDDGYALHAPTGTYLPNGFGLFDVHGNVWEWTRDVYGPYTLPARAGDGERPGSTPYRTARGGAFDWAGGATRSANRWALPAASSEKDLGVRPVRGLR